ncbi:MAG: YeeE/YedE family protein [Myxococcales bacterium]|nr:YeeE/YedE family protein [Myxococcales bacterium]
MTDFTPISSTIGGLLIGLSATLLLALNGRIAGISGIVGGMVAGVRRESWRAAFVAGLVGGGLLIAWVMPQAFGAGSPTSMLGLVAAGLLVGVGTRMGSGCTSGHGVCGLSRASRRSFAATIVFMAAAMITVLLTRGA